MRQSRSNSTKIFTTIAILFSIGFPIVQISWYYVNNVRFNQQCGGYLKLAADANSIELAQERLGKAIDYIEEHQLTTGNTGIFWATPTNDVCEWHKKLKYSHENLKHLPSGLTETDKANTLIKLRETLIDHTKEGGVITAPDYIAQYPSHRLIFFGWIITVVCIIILGGMIPFWLKG